MNESVKTAENPIQQVLNKHRIKEADFKDIYGETGLSQMKAELTIARSHFDKKINQDAAETMEAVVFWRMETNDWLGDFAPPETIDNDSDKLSLTTLLASETDDVLSRTDMILVLNNKFMEGQVISLDMTTAKDADVVKAKFAPAKRNKNLPRGYENLKFVDAEEEARVKGAINMVPHMVIGADSALADRLADLELKKSNGHHFSDVDKAEMNMLDAQMAYIVTSEMALQAEMIFKDATDEKSQRMAEYFQQARNKAKNRLGSLGVEHVVDRVMGLIEHYAEEELIKPAAIHTKRDVGRVALGAYRGDQTAVM